jgi:hypothetical protein
MEGDINQNAIIINSGNNNKSIGSYIDIICNKIIIDNKICIKAYGNNMNKLITIVEILKRETNNKIQIKYSIGKEDKLEYIQSEIICDYNNINDIKNLIGKKKENKRNLNIQNTNKTIIKEKDTNTEEKKIDEICINNINNLFNLNKKE